ncbi:hypothetical protein DITRI_Ditri01bG0006600 [Diplodiscus trichospermus]
MTEDQTDDVVKMEVATVENQQGVAEPANDEHSWSWKRKSFQSCRAKINIHTRYKVIDHIKLELQLCGQAVYDEFQGSCFGHFLDFDSEAVTCNAALHAVLAREIIKPNALADELWFRIGEQSVRFSRVEYCLVTGLKFGHSTFDPNPKHVPPVGGLYDRCFRDQSIVLGDLWDKFKDGQFREAPADALKVTKVLVAMVFLFGVDKRTAVDPWLWALVEDSSRWESFPWGKYTFQMLLHWLRNVPVRVSESGKTPVYHIHGFAIAFLIWAFEAIPSLGSFCATRQDIDVIPRCLRWKMPKKWISMADFFTSQVKSFTTLSPSQEERERHYWQDIEQSIFEGIQYGHPENPFVSNTRTSTASTLTKGSRLRKSSSTTTTTRGASKRQKMGTFASGSWGIPCCPEPIVSLCPPQTVQPPLSPTLMDQYPLTPMDPPHEVQGDPSTWHNTPNDAPGIDLVEDIRGTEFKGMDDDCGSVPICETGAQYQEKPSRDERMASCSQDSTDLARVFMELVAIVRRMVDSAVHDSVDRAVDRVIDCALQRALPDILQRELSSILPTILPDIVRQVVREHDKNAVASDTEARDESQRHLEQTISNFQYRNIRLPLVLEQLSQDQHSPPASHSMSPRPPSKSSSQQPPSAAPTPQPPPPPHQPRRRPPL